MDTTEITTLKGLNNQTTKPQEEIATPPTPAPNTVHPSPASRKGDAHTLRYLSEHESQHQWRSQVMIEPGARQAICRREITAIRKRLQKQYDEQLKVLSTPEEGEALRSRLQQAFDEAVRPYSDDITTDERCRVCGYILYGLPEPRCPECGTQFDPNLLKELTEPGVIEGPSPYTLY